MLLSAAQQSESVIHISNPFWIPFPFRLLQNSEQSSLCSTVGPRQLSILNSVAVNIEEDVSFRFMLSSRYAHRGELAGSSGNSILFYFILFQFHFFRSIVDLQCCVTFF